MKLFVLLGCVIFSVSAMDIGSGGVYDSPFATDFYVRQYGFMFGGGRSGLFGLKAMQESQDRYHVLHLPSFPRSYKETGAAKKMVELSPLMVENTVSKPQMFHRFMAVP